MHDIECIATTEKSGPDSLLYFAGHSLNKTCALSVHQGRHYAMSTTSENPTAFEICGNCKKKTASIYMHTFGKGERLCSWCFEKMPKPKEKAPKSVRSRKAVLSVLLVLCVIAMAADFIFYKIKHPPTIPLAPRSIPVVNSAKPVPQPSATAIPHPASLNPPPAPPASIPVIPPATTP